MSRRRTFLKQLAFVGIGSSALLRTGSIGAALEEADAKRTQAWPKMAYAPLGQTGFDASRLVYGCGAALSRKPADRLLNMAFDHGVNTYDVGTSRYYNNAQRNLSAFLAAHRDDVFLITKDFVEAGANDKPNAAEMRRIASKWIAGLDQSLTEMRVDSVDSYYIMAANNPHVIESEEIITAFERAKDAGKVRFLGFSSHENAQDCLEAAISTGSYQVAMLAITPAGWYDWNSRSVLATTPSMKELRPILDKAKSEGIALVGMKVGRHLAGRLFAGRGQAHAFDEHYSERLLTENLSVFQRSYAYVLEHGMDVVNADIQNFNILEENFIAAARSKQYV